MLFTSSTNLLNRICYRVFRLIPFLNELKATLDWTVATTSLDLIQWIKLDDAYCNLYIDKCTMDIRKQRGLQGQKIDLEEKLLIGVSSVVAIILIIVGPLIMFSSLNPTLKQNNVQNGTFALEFQFYNTLQNTSISYPFFNTQNLEVDMISSKEF